MSPTRRSCELLAIVGHTAGGKTALAAHLADRLNGEIVSADSRQVYRGMDLGTGKDASDYLVNGRRVPWHMVDIVDAGHRYSVFEYQQEALRAIGEIRSRNRLPVLCGGSGLYLESILRNYRLREVDPDPVLRSELDLLTDEELVRRLKSYGPVHNITDIRHRKRLIRAIEIASHSASGQPVSEENKPLNQLVIGIRYAVEERRRRITDRLKMRLEEGMIEEVQHLLERVPAETLLYYGLEYRYLTEYCLGRISRDEMFERLNTAIHQFAKRQMTWFRGMERRGIQIEWIEGERPFHDKIEEAMKLASEHMPNTGQFTQEK